jgi:hypothetical protein
MVPSMKVALALVLLAAACGSSGSTDGDGGADLAAVVGGDDLAVYTPARDAGPLECGAAGVCSGTTSCCIATPPDGGAIPGCVSGACTGGFPVSCAGPGYCGGKPCCLQLLNTMATSVSCSAAPTDCSPTINISGTGMTRVCDHDGDCTDGASSTQFGECCHLTANNYKICFSSVYVGVTMGAIACP